MWIFIIILAFICLLLLMKNRKPSKQAEIPEPNEAATRERKKELGASDSMCLKNLSGFNLPTDYHCGIYLFREKIFVESIGIHLEIPLKYVVRVFMETLSDNSFFRTYKPKLPQFSLRIPSVHKDEAEEVFIEEHRLVFECEVDAGLSDFLVFAFGNDQSQDVKRFVKQCDEFRSGAASEENQKDATSGK